jgi:Uma2 family endonuclease
VQQPFIVGGCSVPEPDVAVVPGTDADYDTQHPTQALLVVEVAASSLPQDRLTKSRIYTAAQVPEYWVVNLRDRCVEVFRDPDAATRLYRDRGVAQSGDEVDLAALPGVSLRVDDLLPGIG